MDGTGNTSPGSSSLCKLLRMDERLPAAGQEVLEMSGEGRLPAVGKEAEQPCRDGGQGGRQTVV